jgi:hypothetical protein
MDLRFPPPPKAPPVLRFRIEQQGAMTRGSTRAELQVWSIDLKTDRTTCVRNRSYRQPAPRAEPVKAGSPDRHRDRGSDSR